MFPPHPVVSDLLMSEAISYYTRNKEEKSEDSGIESGNSLENTGRDIFVIYILNITRFYFRIRQPWREQF